MGTSVAEAKFPKLRRYLLEGTKTHVYFSVERGGTLVYIRAIWGARKRLQPRL